MKCATDIWRLRFWVAEVGRPRVLQDADSISRIIANLLVHSEELDQYLRCPLIAAALGVLMARFLADWFQSVPQDQPCARGCGRVFHASLEQA